MVSIRSFKSDDLSVIDPLTPTGWTPLHVPYEYYATDQHCIPLTAEEGRRVVGVINGAVHGSVGWLGHLVVHSDFRRKGIGEAMTRAAMDALQSNGCRSLALIASPLGARIYERIGFRVVPGYVRYRAASDTVSEAIIAAAEPPSEARDIRLAGLTGRDLDEVGRLDRSASGEERRFLFEGPIREGTGARSPDGTLVGFSFPTLRDGPIVASSAEVGIALLARRLQYVPDGSAIVPAENRAAVGFLESSGYDRAFEVRRMEFGEPIDWRPDLIYHWLSGAAG